MKKLSLCLLLTGLFLLGSCAKAPGKTEAKFKIGISAIMDINNVGAAGAMLWGRSDKGDMFGTVITPSTALDLTLPNGNWMFWAVAWEGDATGKTFSGTVRCAKAGSQLNGSDATVNISLNNGNCALPDFTPSVAVNAGLNQFPDIAHNECSSLNDHQGKGCGAYNVGSKSVSKRLILSSFKKPGNGPLQIAGPQLTSACYSVDVHFPVERLPIGNGFAPFLTSLQSFYSAADCNTADPKGYRDAVYEYGLMGSARLDTIRFINEGSCNATAFSQTACLAFGGSWSSSCSLTGTPQLDISQAACINNGGTYTSLTSSKRFQLITSIPDFELCSGVRANVYNSTPHPFGSGDGSLFSPYTICKETQLNKIGAAYPTSHFSLHADLNMNKTSIMGDQPVPDCLTQRPGSNYIPIGGMFDNSTNCNEIGATAFNGSFNGNNYSISNIRADLKIDDLGFIRVGGQIKNLILKNVEMEGNWYVGAVSGRDASLIQNVKVIKGDIRGSHGVGGIAGKFINNTNEFSGVQALDMSMELESDTSSNAAGGLIGTIGSSPGIIIRKSAFEGLISTYANAERIGGFIGDTTSNSHIQIFDSYSSGALLVSGTAGAASGGFVGYNSTGAVSINESYSKMSIGTSSYKNTWGAAQIGGLVGFAGGTVTVNNGFYLGSIMHPCKDTSNTNCTVGALQGNAAATGAVNTYYGSILYPAWFSAAPSDNTSLATIENSSYKNTLIATGKFMDVGSLMPRLSWETGACALTSNNSSVANQQTSGRGTSLNPIVLCNKEQWKDIKNYQTLHYVLGDNLSLGDMSLYMPTNLTGSITGKGKILSGFHVLYGSGNVGLIQNLSGKLSDIQFAAGFIRSSAGADYAGIVGVNNGTIELSSFDSVNVLGAATTAQGIIAGSNYSGAQIIFNEIDGHLEADSPSAGLITGVNSTSGIIRGISVEGDLSVIASSLAMNVGGAVGVNNGTVSEVEVGSALNNSFNLNSSSRFGAFIGKNNSTTKDILIRPHAQLDALTNNMYHGQVFGHSGTVAQAERIVAVNEVKTSSTYPNSVKHFVAENIAGALYTNSFALNDAVFEISSTALVVSNCVQDSPAAGDYTYSVGIFNGDVNYPNGYYLANNFSQSSLSSRITGTHTDGTTDIISTSSHLQLPCGVSGVDTGKNLYEVKTIANFSNAGVSLLDPAGFGNITTFCPSAPAGDLNYVCSSSEFDIVEDKVNGIGFNRMINAYKTWLTTETIPTTYPVWTMSDEGYPKLFIVD